MSSVTYERHGDVAVLTIDDGKANALSHEVLDALDAYTDQAEAEAAALVLAGRDGMFSGGYDLHVMKGGDPAAVAELVGKGARYAMKLYGLSRPVVAACTGHAVAGGAILLMSSDIRIGPNAPCKIGMIEHTIGMPIPIFAVELARDRLTKSHLTRSIMMAEVFDAAGAIDAGYLDDTADDPLAAALDEATRLGASISQAGLRITRKNMRGAMIAHVLETLVADLGGFTVDDESS